MTYHLRVYVGPTMVSAMACEFRRALLPVTCEGTAHVHVMLDVPGGEPRATFLAHLRSTNGKTYCLTPADVEVIRVTEHVTAESYK